ncbi:MAG: hypothetical protein J7497_05655 [Chitinophagaceae bacterium]|nr:hypothetical protein [Chitinophagaceae bacterium]
MAKMEQGINGPFSGKVGTVVGATWKGKPYMRARPTKRTSPSTDNEVANYSKFAMAHYWLKPILDFVRQGFKGFTETVEGFNAAKSHLLKNSFERVEDKWTINPALVKLSSGNLPLSDDITVQLSAPGQLQFTWDTTIKNDSSPYDQVMLLAYNTDKKTAEMKITGQFRNAGIDTLLVDINATYHIYVAFVADDRSRQSDSVYLGEIAS